MAEGRLIPHHGEAIVLRTWPFHEADLLVSLFTREQGKVKGVARHAMKSRRRFGGALEPATHVRAHYTERPGQELVRLDQFEILWSPLSAPVDYLRTAGLQLVVEVLEEAMPELAADDNIYRLAVTVLTAMEGAPPSSQDPDMGRPESSGIWLPVTYFCLWMNRLMGWMPELGHCAVCGLDLRSSPAQSGTVWWSPAGDGVTCHDDRRPNSRALSKESVQESYRIGRTPLLELTAEAWPAERAADLRAFAIGMLERHLERRLRSATALLPR
jgi:DNA repair protein RecO (recombination protein O)